jgi:hypothetical protein
MKNRKSHLKAILIGGSVFGCAGAFLGYMAGFTSEGASGGFILGWIIGEIFGLGADSSKDQHGL